MAVVEWRLEKLNGHLVLPSPNGVSLFARSEGGKTVQIWLEWDEALQLCKEVLEAKESAGVEY